MAPSTPGPTLRDAYGFAVPPEYSELYLKSVPLYEEDEAERTHLWERFLFPRGAP
eukprot:CAMPEP_0118942156 /NCGR_PEP_ID=MMETSP1169-20130426/35557_1 /TAXON_ID=36882 /ORGANISM="Pyramimonas obovata, Strain CCMP722" /LENGTH=54 /DNA_ID=CAMNT_0006887125 /DNA_START=54 /DNA_END=215 /DNA_ORIENTATION=-